MAYTADLTVGEKSFRIIRCEYGFSQEADLFGKPVNRVSGGIIRVELYGTEDETGISWASNSTKKMDGKISFYRPDQSVFKEIRFEEAFCIRYREDAHPVQKSSNSVPYRHFLEISAKIISIGDIKHDNHWPE